MATRSHAATSLRSETASMLSSQYPKETILRYSDTSEVLLSHDGNTYSGTLIVENPTSRYALFKMKVSKATVFVVKPRVCIVPPHSSVSISITVYNEESFKSGLKAGYGTDPKNRYKVRSSYKFLCEEFVYHPNIVPQVGDINNTESSELALLCKELEEKSKQSAPVDVARLLLYVAVEDPQLITFEDDRSSKAGRSYRRAADAQSISETARGEERQETTIVQSKRGAQLQMSPASVTSPQEPVPNLAEMTQLRAKVDNLIGEVLKISADRDRLAVSLSSRTAELEKLYKEKDELKTLGLRKRLDSVGTSENSSAPTKDEEKSSPRKYHLWVVVLFAILAFLIGRLSK